MFFQLHHLWQIRQLVVAAPWLHNWPVSALVLHDLTTATPYSQIFHDLLLSHVREILMQCSTSGWCGTILPCNASIEGATLAAHWTAYQWKLCLLMHLVHINKAPQYQTNVIATVAQSSTWLGLWSTDTAGYVKSRTRMKLVSTASILPVLTFGIACHHIFILLLILQLLNINLKMNFLGKCSTTDS